MSAAQAEKDDKILAAASDVVGLFHVIRFGSVVYTRLGLALTLIISAAAAVMISARLLGLVVEALVSGAPPADLTRRAAAFLALEIYAVGAQYGGRVQLARATVAIALGIRKELFAKLQRLPIAYFDDQPLGRTITRLTGDVEGVEAFFGGTLAKVLIAMIYITVVLIAMVVTEPRFGGWVVLASIPALVFTVALRKPVRYWLRTYKRRSAGLNARLAEYLSGLPVIRVFGLESWSQRLYDEAAEEQLDAGLRTMNWNSFIRPMAVLLCSLPTLVILWVGGQRVLSGAMELGILVAFIRYSERFTAPIRTISQEIQNIQDALVSSERVRRLLKEDEEVHVLGPDGTVTQPLAGAVSYRDVWMGYDPARPVLKGISFEVAAGMKVAFVGATGSGKSTTANLLPRLYPYQKGEILVDDVPLPELSRGPLRRAIGYVSQDVVVYAGTVRDNLLAAVEGPLGGENSNDAALWNAARRTGFVDVLNGLADGLDHRLVDGGENLSMGERQLLAFTRMLLRNPKLLILDEATAHVDEACERLIQEATFEVMAGRTCFVVAHRLSTIVHCDLILVFQRGEIVEQGRHAELLARGGVYAELVKRQLGAVGA